MKRSIVWMTMFAVGLAVACGGDDAEDAAAAAKEAASNAGAAATDTMNKADTSAQDAVDAAHSSAQGAADSATAAGDAVATCRKFAASGAWDKALEACKKAHEMMPDDLALEHAYQQAKAAAGQ